VLAIPQPPQCGKTFAWYRSSEVHRNAYSRSRIGVGETEGDITRGWDLHRAHRKTPGCPAGLTDHRAKIVGRVRLR
jgi:hypothetical protein